MAQCAGQRACARAPGDAGAGGPGGPAHHPPGVLLGVLGRPDGDAGRAVRRQPAGARGRGFAADTVVANLGWPSPGRGSDHRRQPRLATTSRMQTPSSPVDVSPGWHRLPHPANCRNRSARPVGA
ncbi:hypothetical protein G6F68_017431 [Rhizopus microsporus]|nr:hypothetical protein G6F68_017431 [Rhizopus microsporus]